MFYGRSQAHSAKLKENDEMNSLLYEDEEEVERETLRTYELSYP